MKAARNDCGAALNLFRDEFKVPLIPPDIAAYMATYAETFFPILLVPDCSPACPRFRC